MNIEKSIIESNKKFFKEYLNLNKDIDILNIILLLKENKKIYWLDYLINSDIKNWKQDINIILPYIMKYGYAKHHKKFLEKIVNINIVKNLNSNVYMYIAENNIYLFSNFIILNPIKENIEKGIEGIIKYQYFEYFSDKIEFIDNIIKKYSTILGYNKLIPYIPYITSAIIIEDKELLEYFYKYSNFNKELINIIAYISFYFDSINILKWSIEKGIDEFSNIFEYIDKYQNDITKIEFFSKEKCYLKKFSNYEGMTYLYSCFNLITPKMEENNYFLDKIGNFILSDSAYSFYEKINFYNKINIKFFSNETLFNIYNFIFKDKPYDKNFLLKIFNCIPLLINKIEKEIYKEDINSPLFSLSSGILTKSNINLLSEKDLNKFISAYGNNIEDLYQGQNKIIQELYDKGFINNDLYNQLLL